MSKAISPTRSNASAPADSQDSHPKSSASEDVAIVCGRTKEGVAVLRKRAQSLEAGLVKPLEEGKAITGEVVQLKQRGDTPIFDVETLVQSPSLAPAQTSKKEAADSGFSSERGHPAQVATDTYRAGWDAIFKQNKRSKLLN